MSASSQQAQDREAHVWGFAREGEYAKLCALLEEHPDVDVDGFVDTLDRRPLWRACKGGHTEYARVLVDHRADVNAKSSHGASALHAAAYLHRLGLAELLVQNGADVDCPDAASGWTPLMSCASEGNLVVAQYLLEHKADIHYRVSRKFPTMHQNVLYRAMCKNARRQKLGDAFAFLCCNTDVKKVDFDDYSVTAALGDTHIEEYKRVQSFIDEQHGVLNLVLSEHVQVDTRVGRGDNGIYQEPLERTLEYLGLSMSKDQVVNISIDGEEAVKRALIPGHLLNANHWFDKYKSR
jgi:hypothetical protein